MAKGKTLQTVIDIAGELSPTLGKSIKAVSDKLEGVNLAAVAAGAAIGGIAIATGNAVFNATKELALLGDEFNSAVNNIAATTGLVGDDLEVMNEVLNDVYGAGFGESMDDAAAGITEVYRATGLTDDALAETTKAAFALSDTFGYDVAESAIAAKAMMHNFGVTGEEAMGLIAAGAQNGLDYSGEMIDSISEYSVQFSKLGFTADDMFNIFQQGADSGAWNLDKVGDAVKEFSIRSIDGSKTTIHAFESLGLNADEMMATFAAGGEDASIAFQGVLAALMDMDDEVQRDAIGVELFGTQWEDLGIDAMAALADVNSEAYNAGDALQKINDVQFNNFEDKFEILWREIEVALLPAASAIADALMELMPIVSDLVSQIAPIISELANALLPLIQRLSGSLQGHLQDLMPSIVKFVDDLIPVLIEVTNAFFDALEPILPIIAELIQNLLPVIISILNILLPIIKMVFTVLSPVLGMITQLISALLPPLNELLVALTPVIQFLADLISSVLGSALSAIGPLIDGITGILSNLISFIADVFSGDWEGAWNSIVEVFKGIINLLPQALETVINGAIGLINGLIKGINDIGGTVGISIPLIPTVDIPDFFATGGFTNGLGIVGEDPRYPVEAVLSFNPAYREQNLAYWAEAGRMLGADASDFFGGGSGGGTTIDMGGVTFAPNITITGTADKETVMQAIEEEYPEFLDMLEAYLAERGRMVYA